MIHLPATKKLVYMDDAISKTNYGLFNYLLIVISGLIVFGVAIEICGVVYIIPVAQCDLNLATSDKGILGCATLVGIIFSSHLWGYLADTRGRRAVILPTLFIAFFLAVCSSLIQNFYVLVIFRFLNGVFSSGSSATIYAYLSEFHNNAQRSRAIMAAAVIFSIGCLFVPILAWLVINQDWQFQIPFIDITYKPWRLYFVVCGIPEMIAALVLIFLTESPKFVLGQGDKLGAYEILKIVNRWNNGKHAKFEVFEIFEETESIENRQRIQDCKKSQFPMVKSVWIQTAPLFKPPYLSSTILVCTIQFFIYATCNGFFMFFGEILNKMAIYSDNFGDQRMMMCDIINLPPANTSNTTEAEEICVTKLEMGSLEQSTIYEIIFVMGSILIAILINRLRKFPIMLTIFVATGFGGIACMLTDVPLAQIYSFLALMLCNLNVNILNAVTVELYPTSMRAMAMCISLMFGRLGGVTGSNVAALLLDDHCQTLFYLSSWSIIAMAALTFFIPNIHQKAPNSGEVANLPRHSVISLRG